MTPLFDRLIPILFMGDPEGERDFHVRLGFEITYQGSEFPDFVAMGCGPIEFGLEHKDGFSRDDPGRVLTWQFGVTDLEPAKEQLTAAGVDYDEESVTPSADWRYRVLHARAPNGYDLLLKGGRE
ncbi:MAG: hypothetical protein WKF41_19115 [Gaiellaceae bacterium]